MSFVPSVQFVQDCCQLAELGQSKLTSRELRLPGMSGRMGRHLLNNLCAPRGIRYLEVGLWQGSTFFSALHGNSIRAVGIDNWSEFGGPKAEFEERLKGYRGSNDVTVIDDECFAALDDMVLSNMVDPQLEKFNVYFYDGGHSLQDHQDALRVPAGLLDDQFVLIVDDWQQLNVQRGTLVMMDSLGWEPLWEYAYRSIDCDADRWWCGMYVGLIRKGRP